MMSTANLMAVGIKQPDVPSASPEHGELESESFAQSFEEGMKTGAAPVAGTFGGEAPRSLSGKGPTEGAGEIAGKTKSPIEKGTGGPAMAIEGETGTKTAGTKMPGTEVTEKIVGSAASPGTSGSVNCTDNNENEVIAIPTIRKPTDELPQRVDGELSSQNSSDELAGGVSREGDADGHGVSVVSPAQAAVMGANSLQKGKAVAGKTEQAAPGKKTEKVQHLAKQGIVPSTTIGAPNLGGGNAVPNTGGGGQGQMPAAAPRETGPQEGVDDVPKSARVEVGPMTNYAAKGPVENTRGAASGPADTATARPSTVELTVAPGQEQAGSARPVAAVEKASGSSISGAGEIDSRTQGMVDAAATIASALGSSVAPPVGISASPVVHTPLESGTAAQKTHAGEDVAHGPGLQAGVAEMNGHSEAGLSSDSSPRMLMASPTALEVGIQNGTHGWLKVRAEISDGGAVSASVSAASSAGQEMLHRELPALTAYLQQEKVAVSAIVVHASAPMGTDYRNSASEMGGGPAQQRGNEGGQRQQNAEQPVRSRPGEMTGYAGPNPGSEEGVLSSILYPTGGGWLSVRA